MTWIPLLLTDPSPNLRLLVLRELLGRSEDDPEVAELRAVRERDELVRRLVALQRPDGSWAALDSAASRGTGPQRATAYALARLGYLGFGSDHPSVRRGVEHLFSLQGQGGEWSTRGDREGGEEKGYSMIPLWTTIPLMALASCGYAADPRAERAYDWLLEQRLPDGAWPSGIVSGTYGGVAGYRRLPHSRWGCRSNTTGALICLSLHPTRRKGEEARRALDLLLGRETRDRNPLGFETVRLIGGERTGGALTHHASFDLGLVLKLCWRIGASSGDHRVAGIVEFVKEAQGPYGLWEYLPRPELSRWVTFDLLRSLSRLGERDDWVSTEPRTPFRAYSKEIKRY
jgi:hypothetical protein